VPEFSGLNQASASFSGFTVIGTDAARFLQGQLSCDVLAMQPGAATLGGLHNPQGRVIAVLYLRCLAADHYTACLPADLVDSVVNQLRRFVLRAKAVLTRDDTIALPEPLRSVEARIAQGVPMVYSATSGRFVAQMLNLDTLGAISFSKGCYTGQEIIARTHYKGRVKRRMQRVTLPGSAVPAPGTTLTLADGRGAEVVEAAGDDDGLVTALAVTVPDATAG
jgi:tRNA-modifying protein YgfZ